MGTVAYLNRLKCSIEVTAALVDTDQDNVEFDFQAYLLLHPYLTEVVVGSAASVVAGSSSTAFACRQEEEPSAQVRSEQEVVCL